MKKIKIPYDQWVDKKKCKYYGDYFKSIHDTNCERDACKEKELTEDNKMKYSSNS